MITSKQQAGIEVGVASGLLAAALLPGASAAVRAEAALGGVLLTVLSAVTDYEGGAFPIVSLAQHRALQAACGTALCVGGLRRGGRDGGWALSLAGSAQLALALIGPKRADAGPPDTLYGPLDTPKPLAEGLWIVDSRLGPGLPVRMTVIRLENGDVLLHSPTRFDPALLAAIEAIGPIRHIVAPSTIHWVFVKPWQDVVSMATVWAVSGLAGRAQVRRAGLRIDHVLSDTAPAAWAGQIDQAAVRGGFGFVEVAMFHRASRTALMTDLVQNVETGKLPWLFRPLARLLGNAAPEGGAPAHLRALVGMGRPSAEAVGRIIGWAPDRVVVAHGEPVEADAAGYLRRSLAWLAAQAG